MIDLLNAAKWDEILEFEYNNPIFTNLDFTTKIWKNDYKNHSTKININNELFINSNNFTKKFMNHNDNQQIWLRDVLITKNNNITMHALSFCNFNNCKDKSLVDEIKNLGTNPIGSFFITHGFNRDKFFYSLIKNTPSRLSILFNKNIEILLVEIFFE